MPTRRAYRAIVILASIACIDTSDVFADSPPAQAEAIAYVSPCDAPAGDIRRQLAICSSFPEWLVALPRAQQVGDLDLSVSDGFAKKVAEVLDAALAKNLEAARTKAAALDFHLGLIGAIDHDLIVLYPNETPSTAPVLVVNPAYRFNVVVEVPHATFESGTMTEGAVALLDYSARALLVAGSDRCSSTRASDCTGTTAVCGAGNEPYRASDVAHSPNTAFGRVHSILNTRFPDALFVQFHGMRARPPYWAILSDGTKSSREAAVGLPERVRDALRSRVGGDRRRFVSCQDATDQKETKVPLCATDNVQGRELNGSATPCTVAAEKPSGRFLHVEQSWDLLGTGTPGRPVLEALFGVLAKERMFAGPETHPR